MTEQRQQTQQQLDEAIAYAQKLFPHFEPNGTFKRTGLAWKNTLESALCSGEYKIVIIIDIIDDGDDLSNLPAVVVKFKYLEHTMFEGKGRGIENPAASSVLDWLRDRLDDLGKRIERPAAEIKIAVTEADLQIAQNFWNLAGRMGKTRLGSGNYRVQQAMRAIAFCIAEGKLPEAARKLCTKGDVAAIVGNDNYTNRFHRQTMFSAEEVSAATEAIDKCLLLTPIENLVGQKLPNGLTD